MYFPLKLLVFSKNSIFFMFFYSSPREMCLLSDENNEIIYGSEFLGYLYRQIIDVTQQEISIMLILILSDCCDVYFR